MNLGQLLGVFLMVKLMAKEWARQFYGSKAWKTTRQAYINKRIAIDGGMCEACHLRPGVIVHHKRHLNKDNINNPDVALNHMNLMLECKACHDREEEHFIKKKKILCGFDKNGQPLPPL